MRVISRPYSLHETLSPTGMFGQFLVRNLSCSGSHFRPGTAFPRNNDDFFIQTDLASPVPLARSYVCFGILLNVVMHRFEILCSEDAQLRDLSEVSRLHSTTAAGENALDAMDPLRCSTTVAALLRHQISQ